MRATASLLGELSAYYFTLDDPERALPLAKKAWEMTKNASIGMNLSLIYKDLGRHAEAFHVVEEAYWLADQNDYYVRLGYGEALLKHGFWKQAWPIYSGCRPTQMGAAMDLRLPAGVREWQGEPLPDGHTLLVIAEGGTGDRICYPRFLPELTKRGINWKYYPYQALYSIFERLFPADKLVEDGSDISATHWVTCFDLPAKLNVGPNETPEPLPVTASPDSIEKYKMNSSDGMPIIGICWEAAEMFQGGRQVRSLSRGQAMRLVTMLSNQFHFINLQHGITADYPIVSLPFKTWEDTLGIIHNLDAVITVDTSTLHIAGAMKKPTAALLSGNSCWKYGTKEKKCWFYPEMTLYRNDGRGVDNAIDKLIVDARNGIWPVLEK